MTQYFNSLNNIWHELDLYYESQWHCSEDAIKYKRMLDKEHIFDFLYGLNKELDEVRGRILGKNHLPSIREAFVEVRHKESRKKVMMGLVKEPETERSAMVTKKTDQSTNQKGQKHRERPYCDYCHRKGHTQDSY